MDFMDNRNFIDTTTPLTVTQLTVCIKDLLEGTFSYVKIEGEVSNWRPSAAGHIYFTLKDEKSQIKAVMFKGYASHLNFTPRDGDKVCCKGNISVYGPQGTYQVIVTSIEKSGEGDILQMLEERKRKLADEGLFDESRKKKLPKMPFRIGVVTSPTGAAIRDIVNVIKRRNSKISITVLPAIVQGEEAASTIVQQIKNANEYNICDVLIVGRGGGSLEDLLPFSEESVVRAIAKSKIPVISAVGHEIDWALCDYAADVRAPTPSAAAELAVPKLSDIEQQIAMSNQELYEYIKEKINQKKLLIKSYNPENLEMRFRNIEQPLVKRFEFANEKIKEEILKKIADYKKDIKALVEVLESASPKAIFEKGYAMVKNEKGDIIKDASKVSKKEILKITVANGDIDVEVI